MEETRSGVELLKQYYLTEQEGFLMDLKFFALISLVAFLLALGLFIMEFSTRLLEVRRGDFSQLKFNNKFASCERDFKLKYLQRKFKGYRVEIKRTGANVVSQIILHEKNGNITIIAK